jgi:hypothetical protein
LSVLSVLLRQQILSCGQASPVAAQLPFADHVHKLDATQNDPRTTETLERCIGRVMRVTARGSCSTMLLRHLYCRITTLVPCFILQPLIPALFAPIMSMLNVDDLEKAGVLDSAREDAPRRTTIAFGEAVPALHELGV